MWVHYDECGKGGTILPKISSQQSPLAKHKLSQKQFELRDWQFSTGPTQHSSEKPNSAQLSPINEAIMCRGHRKTLCVYTWRYCAWSSDKHPG